MVHGQNPKYHKNNPCSCSKAPKSYRYGECSSTRAIPARTLQAYGSGKGTPLTGKAEGGEIVNSYMKV